MTSDQKQKMKVHIRLAEIRRDGPEILKIERVCFEHPWEKWHFIKQCKLRNGCTMVAEIDDRIVGYVFCVLNKTSIEIVNLAVAKGDLHRRRGIGRQLVEKVFSKTERGKRNRVDAAVSETNLLAQLFFRAMGFKAIEVIRDYYKPSNESMYWFVHKLKGTHPFVPRNRLEWKAPPHVADV